MKNTYFIYTITLFLFLGACQSADEKRACEILDELNGCWSSISDASVNESNMQAAVSCQSNLMIQLSVLEVELITNSDDKRKMILASNTSEQCLNSATKIDEIKMCLYTFIQVTKDILSCR